MKTHFEKYLHLEI